MDLISVFEYNFSNNGIFHYLQQNDVPWKDLNIAAFLDFDYFGNISGTKKPSMLVRRLLNIDKKLSDNDKQYLADLIFNLYKVNWDKLYSTMQLEYNPIENYSMTETTTSNLIEDLNNSAKNSITETGTIKDNGSSTLTSSFEEDRKGSDNYTDTKTIDNTNTNIGTLQSGNSIFGFNSVDGVELNSSNGSSSDTVTQKGEEALVHDGTNNVTMTNEQNSTTINENTSSTNTSTDTDLTSKQSKSANEQISHQRSGNIGVTTSQQMIESERNLWQWNFFRNVVYKNIDDVLSQYVYYGGI